MDIYLRKHRLRIFLNIKLMTDLNDCKLYNLKKAQQKLGFFFKSLQFLLNLRAYSSAYQ